MRERGRVESAGMSTQIGFEIRRANASDAGAIAEAHRDSIRSIGPQYYPSDIVERWSDGLTPDLYVRAMDGGEVFFIATGQIDGEPAILGFASDYCIDGTQHGTSVYVRGVAARRGIGSALFRRAEALAIDRGAASMHVEASLAGVDFYKANAFVEVARGETRLMSGHAIACVYMRKILNRIEHRHTEAPGTS
jgi:GNAT superfamily N-acetyltransferase